MQEKLKRPLYSREEDEILKRARSSDINSCPEGNLRQESITSDPFLSHPKKDMSLYEELLQLSRSNIAEKVKINRRKASLKSPDPEKKEQVRFNTKVIKDSTKSFSPLNEESNHKTKAQDEFMNTKHKQPLRISLKINLHAKKNKMSGCEAYLNSKRPPSMIQLSKNKTSKNRKTSTQLSSSSSSSAASTSSSSDSSESDDSNTSDGPSSSTDGSSSSSCSESSSSSNSSSSSSSSMTSQRSRKRKIKNHSHESYANNRSPKMDQLHATSPPRDSPCKLKIRGIQQCPIGAEKRKAEKNFISRHHAPEDGPSARPLTAAELRAILAEDDAKGCEAAGSWVRRSTRQPSRSGITAPNVREIVQKLEMNDPDMVVLKCKKYLNNPDTPSVIVDAMLDALENNTNCQALYIQNFNYGMKDEQVLHLLRILQQPSCNIWCLNIGETYNVKRKTWAQFTIGLKRTKITHMYASEHTISSAMKEKIREIIRENRSKHDMHINPDNLEVIIQCTHCWWNPINSKALQPYIKQRGLEDILNDKVIQGINGYGNI